MLPAAAWCAFWLHGLGGLRVRVRVRARARISARIGIRVR